MPWNEPRARKPGYRRARHQQPAHRGARPAAGLVCRFWCGQLVLLGMMAPYTQADIIVVGLIGERGREVKEFVEDILGAQDRSRAVVVAAPADAPPLLRMQGASYATAIAEYFRDEGKHVLLANRSLTRMPRPSADRPGHWRATGHQRLIPRRALPAARAGRAQRQWS